jgi:ferric-dicitrate binding protein FerR (iron transport regulator)
MAVVLLWRSAPSSAPEVVRSYATNSREQAVVTLIDGTRVMLAPNTTLRLREFSGRIRAVDVDGEAYLDVVHASGAPFIVRSGRMNLRVLGTTFLVRHRPGDVRVGVAVVDGRVRMTMGAGAVSGVTLSAGEVGEGMDSTIAVNTVSDIVPGAEWTHDQLLFHDTPLSTILAMVGRWYGYQFRYADSTLPSRKVTLGVSTQSSAEALAEIERVLKVNLAVVGDTITLVPGVRGTQQERHKMRTYDTWTPSREVGR